MELIPGNTLITASPQEGRELAITIARKSIGAIQPDAEVRKTLRPGYATDAEALTMAAHVVAVEFATIAAANDYWRKKSATSAFSAVTFASRRQQARKSGRMRG